MLFRFRKFPVYKDARRFRKAVYLLANKFPKEEIYNLTSQIKRAANSILLNIAEGSNRMSDKDFGRFLINSSSSLEEVIACLDIALDEKYISKNEHQDYILLAEELGKQLIGFTKKLRNN
ncbi:MAG: four helix bundle protein [Patescibacteria group bacterium]|nr:four helix bundle protein [Patescibacteria group bacterium]